MVTDPLTGVYSRATLESRLHEEIQRAERYDAPFSIVLLDLDHYKSVNDAFGHLRGDKILQEFAERLSSLIRKSDILFRYGGDEFLVLLPNTNNEQALQLAQRLLDGVRGELFRGKPPLYLSISLGVSSFPDDARSPEALFEKADQRHYEAKRRGRGRIVSADSAKPPLLPFDQEARLVERDDGLLILHRFLRELPDKRRGILAVTGTPGSGRARFLSEVGKVARLQGYEVISFRGSPALKNRTFGDLAEVCTNWETLPPPSIGNQAFGMALQRLIEEKGRTGLLFTVDNLSDVDWPALELLRYLLLSSATSLPILIGLAFSANQGAARSTFPLTAPLTDFVELGALSREGFQIWLRMILKWEAPPDFTAWLYEQTNGLPTFLQRGLTDLVERGLLERSGDGWIVTREFTGTSLIERLGLPNTLPAHNLPAAPTSFVGRELEILEAKHLLRTNRLLTLIGPGGVGKTRLAVQVSMEVIESSPQPVYWIPLASVSSIDFLVSTVANALKFSFYSHEDPEIQLFNFLREKQMFLVLDNFEHLTEGANLLARILENAPFIKILITSRERLNIRGEAILELSGMSVPPLQMDGQIEDYSAVQLFVQSARRSAPDFVLDEATRPSVARICQLVDGLPLGIELAAAWIRVLPCEEIAAEIQQNLDFLTTQMADVPERHRSLRAVFEHSWNLLHQEEQKVLRQVAVFEGGFHREAAAAVAGASLMHLTTLLDKTLLRKSTAGRYEMHEVLRQYAAVKLKEHPAEFEQSLLRHCEFFTAFLQERESLLRGERQKEALDAIGEEVENVRAAWRSAVALCKFDLLEKALESLFIFYEIRGLSAEGEDAFRSAQIQLISSINPKNPKEQEKSALMGALLARRGALATHLSRYDEARQLLDNSLNILRELQDPEEIAFTLYQLGILQTALGEYDQARQTCQQSLLIYKEINDRQGIGRVLNELGAISYQQGEYQRAEQYHKESLRLFREINDRWGLARTLINLGNVEAELGEYSQARQFYRESLALCEEISAQTGLAPTLNNIGDISRETGNYPEAREYLSRSIEIYRQIGDRYGMAVALDNLAVVAFHQGEYQEAQQLLDQSIHISEQTGNRLQFATSLAHLASVASITGDFPSARKHFSEALRLAMDNQATPLILEILVDIAALMDQLGEKTQALELLIFTINHPATIKSKREEAELLRSYLESELPYEVVQQAHDKWHLRPIHEVVKEMSKASTFAI